MNKILLRKLILVSSALLLIGCVSPAMPSPASTSTDQSEILVLVQSQLKYLHAGDWVSVYATCNPVFRERYRRTTDEVKSEFTRSLDFFFGGTPAGIDLRNPRVIPIHRDGDYVVVELERQDREYSPVDEGEIAVVMFDAYEFDQLVSTGYWKPFAKVGGKWYDDGPACR